VRRFLVPVANRPLAPGPVPTFSVVIPAYEAAEYVTAAVESALDQTRPALEVIVSDDGSTDALDAVLTPYSGRVGLVRGPQQGPPAARNRGFRAAVGDFVVNLDADDMFHPTRLEALGDLASARPDLDILTTDAYYVHAGERLRRCYWEGWPFYTRDQRRRILQRNFLTSEAAVRRTRFLEIGGFDEEIVWCDDWDFWLRLLLDGSLAGCVDEPLADKTVREGNVSARRLDVLRASIQLLEKAQASTALDPSERDTLALTIAEQRREFERFEIQAALVRGEAGVRRRAFAVARRRDHLPGTRLKMFASALLPGFSRRLLRRRQAREWVGAGGTKVRRA
jgi:glycosyltransferase involved in cell wall biosynthesis